MSPQDDLKSRAEAPADARKKVTDKYLLKLLTKAVMQLAETATVSQLLLDEIREVANGKR